MIFVTVGSATYKFDRLFKIIDNLCDEKILNGKDIIAQTGYTKYSSKNYKCFDMVENAEFKKILNKSNIIICHAGVGTIINSLKLRKKVIVFPRLEKYGEHSDNHQIEIAKSFMKNGYIKYAKNEYELKKILLEINQFNPSKFTSNNKRINKIILNFIKET